MPALYPDQSLDAALQLFGDRAVLAVVSREEVTRVLGELTLEDVLRAYGIGNKGQGSEPDRSTGAE